MNALSAPCLANDPLLDRIANAWRNLKLVLLRFNSSISYGESPAESLVHHNSRPATMGIDSFHSHYADSLTRVLEMNDLCVAFQD
jgi:hypothetical protein